MVEVGGSTTVRRCADAGVADTGGRGGRGLDRRGDSADFLRIRQHAGGVTGGDAVHDRCGLRAAGRAGAGGRGLGYFTDVQTFDHVKVVSVVNFAEVFPSCRAVVHHGGSGTTALGLRAGVPTLILSTDANQALWGSQIKRLKVGTGRRFSAAERWIRWSPIFALSSHPTTSPGPVSSPRR